MDLGRVLFKASQGILTYGSGWESQLGVYKYSMQQKSPAFFCTPLCMGSKTYRPSCHPPFP